MYQHRMPKTSKYRKPIYLPNATKLGYAKHSASVGDVVFFDDYAVPQVGRVFGYATQTGGGAPVKPRTQLVCLVLGSNMSLCYWRFVGVNKVTECRSPDEDGGAFIRWFFSAKMTNEKQIAAAEHYGALSDRAIAKYLDKHGELRDDWKLVADVNHHRVMAKKNHCPTCNSRNTYCYDPKNGFAECHDCGRFYDDEYREEN